MTSSPKSGKPAEPSPEVAPKLSPEGCKEREEFARQNRALWPNNVSAVAPRETQPDLRVSDETLLDLIHIHFPRESLSARLVSIAYPNDTEVITPSAALRKFVDSICARLEGGR